MKGILTPFRRDRKNDFAFGASDELLKSQVIQVLMVEGDTPQSSGELPWRTGFGSAIHLAKHHRNDAVISELIRVYARDALKRWLPAVTVNAIDVQQRPGELSLNVQFQGKNRRENVVEAVFL